MFIISTIDPAKAGMITSENVDNLISHLIWPITLIIVLLIFRRNLKTVLDKIATIRADATGVTLEFIDKEIEAVESYQETEEIEESNSENKPKSGPVIGSDSKPKKPKIKTPHYELLSIRTDLRDRIVQKAQENQIDTQGKSSLELRDELIDKGALSPRNAHVFSALINLTSTAGPAITNDQVKRIRVLFDNMKL